jgi:hypothetical protein
MSYVLPVGHVYLHVDDQCMVNCYVTSHDTVTNPSITGSLLSASHASSQSSWLRLVYVYVDVSTCEVNLHRISSAV